MRQSWLWLFTWQGSISRLPYFLSGPLPRASQVCGRPLGCPSLRRRLPSVGLLHSPAAAVGLSPGSQSVGFLLSSLDNRHPILLGRRCPQPSSPFLSGQAGGMDFSAFPARGQPALFLWLSIAPSQPSVDASDAEPDEAAAKPKPYLSGLGVVVATAIGIALVRFSTQTLVEYANGLFLGVPFVAGFILRGF